MRNRQQIIDYLKIKLIDHIEGNDIIMTTKNHEITHTRLDENQQPISYIELVGISRITVDINTFIDFYEDDLKDDTYPVNILTIMKIRKFYHPVTFVEIDKGYGTFIQKLIYLGIYL